MSGKTISFQNTEELGYWGIITLQKIAFISKYGSSLFPKKNKNFSIFIFILC